MRWFKKEDPSEFWRWFAGYVPKLEPLLLEVPDPQPEHHTEMRKVQEALDRYDRRLVALCGTNERGQFDLVISANGDVAAFEQAEALVAIAPRIPGWLISALKPRRSIARALMVDDSSQEPDTVRFLMTAENSRAQFIILLPDWDAAMEKDYPAMARMFLEAALGEQDMAQRVSGISVAPVQSFSAADIKRYTHPLRHLPREFDRVFHPPQ